MTTFIAISISAISFSLGFISFWACRVGYKALIEVLKEENKESEAY